jgi:DNA-directed RNA polymerase specialized sigma24 family protein
VSKPSDIEALLQAQDWSAIHLRLVAYTRRRLRGNSIETSKEIVQEALTRLWDSNYTAWNPVEQPDLVRHLGSVVNGLIRNHHSSAAERTTVSTFSTNGVPEAPLEGPARHRVDGDVDRTIEGRRVVDRLLTHLADKEKILTDLLMLFSTGTDKAADQAVELGIPVAVVYSARRRFDAELKVVRALLEKGEMR